MIAPLGQQHTTGAGPFGLLVGPAAHTVVTSNGGPGANSFTVLDHQRDGRWSADTYVANSYDAEEEFGREWRGLFMGLAYINDHAVWASEGNSGKVSLFDWVAARRRSIDLNQGDFKDSYTGDLAIDPDRNILYVVDQANFRVAAIDLKTRAVIASVAVGRLPFALALSPDRHKLYVTNVGMFQYRMIPGADPDNPRATGLPFPAFGFPSADAVTGARRETEKGPVDVPGLGDPNVRESNSLCVVDVSTPTAPKVAAFIRTGVPVGKDSAGGSSPSGVLAAGGRVYVSNSSDDSITVIDPQTNTVAAEIALRIPGLETLRGVLPIGMAYHEKTGWLLVAEAGINAVAVIDTHTNRVLGHLPAGWFPTRVAVDGDTVFVTNAKGNGSGPNGHVSMQGTVYSSRPREGSISIYALPPEGDLAADTSFVMEANGFTPRPAPPPLPDGVHHVVLIVKENRTYDEVMGDEIESSAGPPMGAPMLARFGSRGYTNGHKLRLSLRDIDVTPNHHAIAETWGFSDNFYADSDVSVDGHHWLVGAYPSVWTETSLMAAYSDQKKDFRPNTGAGRLEFAGSDSSVHPEDEEQGGTIWRHFARHGLSFLNFGEGFELAGVDEDKDLEPTGARFLTNVPMPEPLYSHTDREYPGFNMNIPDQYRATQFEHEIDAKFVKTGVDLPQFIYIHLPNDHMADARPEDGYPYQESFVVDNDYALGRIVEYLSHTKWWSDMAVFITEDDPQGGVDHIDAHRTVLLYAGPWFKKGYVSHINTSFPGLLKTIFGLLKLPPLNLFDASAAELSDIFAQKADPAPYKLLDVDRRVFNPEKARQSTNGKPSLKMDDPKEVKR
ncbi:MAG TPA: bifunctional YncE family protein/alkaline phosphatase family protein [Bryobacteraceae bacterium]|nr:bifunctional YncE family protein/alkaline phosphatase family protein [Bryobacteraceae bacterium]